MKTIELCNPLTADGHLDRTFEVDGIYDYKLDILVDLCWYFWPELKCNMTDSKRENLDTELFTHRV